MRSKELIDGHFIGFQLHALELFLQVPDHQGLIQFFLLGKTGGIDGIKARQPFANVLFLLLNMREGVIAPAIVITVVAQGSGRFGAFAHLVFPFVGE